VKRIAGYWECRAGDLSAKAMSTLLSGTVDVEVPEQPAGLRI
jgi:hypothetical protein